MTFYTFFFFFFLPLGFDKQLIICQENAEMEGITDSLMSNVPQPNLN